MSATATVEKPVVIYDGECRFCVDQVQRLKRMDRNGAFEFVPRQDPAVDQRFPILTTVDFNSGLRLVEPDGSVFAGADAFYQMARVLPSTRAFAWLYHVPGVRPIAHRVYAWIAANRKKLGKTCENDACKI
jgi:predicted DCC family thiol-disulfide oxidoreductase YuxK